DAFGHEAVARLLLAAHVAPVDRPEERGEKAVRLREWRAARPDAWRGLGKLLEEAEREARQVVADGEFGPADRRMIHARSLALRWLVRLLVGVRDDAAREQDGQDVNARARECRIGAIAMP